MKRIFSFVSVLIVVIMILTACAPKSTSSEVEVFSWWVGPGEADGLAAMVKVFNAEYPNITFVNAAVTGGAGTNAKAV
jgi:glucose/mannose transport system substrate-binding protein